MKARSNKQTATSEKSLEQRLRFETLLAEISGRFINLPADRIDGEIVDAQRRVCELLDLDRSTLWQAGEGEPGTLLLTHFYQPPGSRPAAKGMNAGDFFPWATRKVLAGETVIFSELTDLPPEADLDLENWRAYGTKSDVLVPLSVGAGPVFGLLTFAVLREERRWPATVVTGFKLIAQMFANALNRKFIEGNLRESEERFRVTFEQAAVGIAHVSPEGNFVRINRKFCDIVGFSREEMLERKFQDITYPDDLEADLTQLNRLLSGKINTYSMEKRYICKDGGLVWINLSVTLVRNEAGRPLWFVSIVEDINDRKRVQKQLEERLKIEKLLTVLSTRFINIPLHLLDAEIQAAQQHICECLGLDVCVLWQFSPHCPGNLTMSHIYAPPDFPGVTPETKDAKVSFPWCLEMVTKKEVIVLPRITSAPAAAACDVDGWKHYGIKSVLTFPLSMGDGPSFGALNFNTVKGEQGWPEELVNNLKMVAQIFTNALIRKQTDTALRESEMRLNLATEAVGAGLWIMDTDSGRVWVSTKSRELFHFSPDEEIGYERYFKVIHPEDRDRVHQDVQRALRSGENLHTDYRIVLPDGSVRWITARGQSYPQSAEAPERIMGLSFDVTDQKKNEHEMAQLRLDLTHLTRVAMLNEMSASLAHEISQPLGAILFNAEAAKILLSQAPDKREAVPEIVAEIIQDVRRTADVVRKIRGIVKKAETHFEPLSINDLIDEILALLRGSIAMNDVTLRLDLKPDLANIRGDRVRLQQVLMNLGLNALEAMKEASPRILTIRSAMDGQGMVTVSVGDSGPGIVEARQALLFQPFFTTKKDGLGLGLHICRSIIEEHGGRIWEEDRPGGGATFSFSLKAWREENVLA